MCIHRKQEGQEVRGKKLGGIVIKLPDIGRISAEVFNELIEPKFGMNLIEHGNEKKLQHPIVDPFWQAFYKALQERS